MSKPSKIRMSPFDYAIHHFGGVRSMGRLLGVQPSQISRLRRKRDKTGKVGLIPGTMQQKILEHARVKELPITTDNVVYGGEVEVKRAARR